MSKSFPRGFYRFQKGGSIASAQVVLPQVLKLGETILERPIRSILDLGCGTGTWLKVAQELGISEVLGVDGDDVNKEDLEIPADKFLAHDLKQPLKLPREFDLAISLEVAEHLPEDSAQTFINSLVSQAPVVLFSAAIPFQGGPGHVNEQWPDYWVDLFAQKGYVPFDVIRSKIWGDERIEWWYRQNMILFLKNKLVKTTSVKPLSLVHPKCFLETAAVNLEEIKRRRYSWD